MRLLPVAFLTAFLAAGADLPAQEGPHFLALASGISLDQAVKMAEQRFKARVVRAETQQSDGHTVYMLARETTTTSEFAGITGSR